MFPEPRAWQLTVKTVEDPTPKMRSIALTASTLDRFTFLPGQDVSLAFAARDGSTVRRRYSIRAFDPDRRTIEINVVMHGDGPGMRWAQSATPGSEIEAIGPRGKITLANEAEWHLFAGDATAVPAALAMMDALPAQVQAFAFFLVDGPEERQAFASGGALRTVEWRYGMDPRSNDGLLQTVHLAALSPGRGHAYFAGEVALVSSLKAELLARGWGSEQINAKAYWNRGRANAGHGEPEQKVA